MRTRMLRMLLTSLLLVGFGPVVCPADTPSKVAVHLLIHVCEGREVDIATGKDVETRERECIKPVPDVPLTLFHGETKLTATTDDAGFAVLGPTEVGIDDPVRVLMGCTTHICMTIRLTGVRAGDLHERDNPFLVFVIPKPKGDGSAGSSSE